MVAAVGEGDPMSERESRGSDDGETAFRARLEGFLRDKGKGRGGASGTYRANAERELRLFVDWLEDPRGESTGGEAPRTGPVLEYDDLDAQVLREYVRSGLLPRDLSPKSVHKYYDYVSSFVGWCQREGLVPEHYGIQRTAREPLPDTEGQKTEKQQTWRREERLALLRHVDREAHDAIDERGRDALSATRNRALVYVLAYTGVRGGEILALPQDDRRNGEVWGSLSVDYATMDVLSKKQDRTTRAIPSQARPALERWHDVLRPREDWPLFPTFHLPTLYERLDGVLDDDEKAALTGLVDVFDAMRERGVPPPAITTDGARSIMKRLTDDAGIEVDRGEYLELHGARRGVGRVLAMTQGADAAADQLDNSVKVVEEAYSDVLAEERADATSEAFESHDGN